MIGWVLGKFPSEQKQDLQTALDAAAKAAEDIILNGTMHAMNSYNAKRYDLPMTQEIRDWLKHNPAVHALMDGENRLGNLFPMEEALVLASAFSADRKPGSS